MIRHIRRLSAIGLLLPGIAGAAADTVRFSFFETSQSKGAQEAMVVEDGRWFTRRHLSHGAILVEHPQGTLLYDTGLGTQVDEQFAVNSWLARQLFAYTEPAPVLTQMQQHQYPVSQLDAIIPSHLHWDHASGLVDFPGIPVLVQKEELDGARAGEKPGFLQSQITSDAIAWQYLELRDEPFLSFDRSLDLYGDGTVVLVDLSGHTPGQVGLYLKLSDTEQYLFIGDTTWVLEGVVNNQPRPGLIKLVTNVDGNEERARRRVSQVHRLLESHPELTLVPAHDERVAASLPHFPAFSPTTD
ncbi:MAG: MBL fold metallo-hydrolase [Marinobacter sp.]|uniref:MBL fold metallo-hydrolase n=1 Tax=Marinobacter sp. TaxID=50741 RepID=UPI00299E89A3|nr:MBL fold metallo-hydrolase [Marinobacter sp.]MDX1757054.1 MBL fold metallo-hydrolase [Marinobacter sp.]